MGHYWKQPLEHEVTYITEETPKLFLSQSYYKLLRGGINKQINSESGVTPKIQSTSNFMNYNFGIDT